MENIDVDAELTPGKVRLMEAQTRVNALVELKRPEIGGGWITAVIELGPSPGENAFRDVMLKRLLKFGKFRSVVKRVRRKLAWLELDLSEMDMDYHWKEVNLADGKGASQQQVQEYIGKMYDNWKPDHSRPLWSVEFIPELENGGSMLLTRFSHVLGDGTAMVKLLNEIIDPHMEDAISKRGLAARRKRKPAFGPLHRGYYMVKGIFDGLTVPLTSRDPKGLLSSGTKTGPSSGKTFSMSEGISLERVKALKEKLGGPGVSTVNDVMMMTLHLTLRSFYEEENAKSRGKFTVAYPVDIRGKKDDAFDQSGEPFNKWSVGYLRMDDVGDRVSTASDRSLVKAFWRQKRVLDKAKYGSAPLVAVSLLNKLTMFMPESNLMQIGLDANDGPTASLSNVIGPTGDVRLAGAKVTHLSFLLHTPVSVYCGLISFAGMVNLNISIEKSLNVEASALTKFWTTSFEKFEAAIDAEAAKHGGYLRRRRGLLDCL